jgi:hypothetical protein
MMEKKDRRALVTLIAGSVAVLDNHGWIKVAALILFLVAADLFVGEGFMPWVFLRSIFRKRVPSKDNPNNEAPFPHCDQRVLHAPGSCQYCDAYPKYQELRVAWGINFTGIMNQHLANDVVVMFGPYAGTKITVGGEAYLTMSERELKGWICSELKPCGACEDCTRSDPYAT